MNRVQGDIDIVKEYINQNKGFSNKKFIKFSCFERSVNNILKELDRLYEVEKRREVNKSDKSRNSGSSKPTD